MKKKLLNTSNYCRWACVLVTVTSVGCRSTGKFTPSFLAWNRAPDAATLAGGSEVPDLPESPASKYTPNAIASVGAKTPSPAAQSPVATTPGSAYGYNPTTASTPNSQLAAAANGYQTGPYELAPQAGSLSSNVTAPNTRTGALPSPYGGSASGVGTAPKMADIALPNSVAGAMTVPSTPVGYPNQAAGVPDYPSVGQAKPQSTMPMATYPSGAGATGYPTSTPSFPAIPGTTATSASTSPPAYPSLPPVAGSASSAGSAASSAYQGSSTVNRYSPGSTGRSTGYDFSTGSTAAPSTAVPGSTLPPNTANQNSPMLR
jgi:hypothetical protein